MQLGGAPCCARMRTWLPPVNAPPPAPPLQAPLLPKLRAASPDYREAASHYSAHDEVG